jgi:nitrous oxide reductase
MARRDFPLNINRRRLLATGAAAATAAIAPGAGGVETALANAAQPASLPAEAPPPQRVRLAGFWTSPAGMKFGGRRAFRCCPR